MNLKAQHSAIADELKEAVCRVIDRSLFVSGEEVALFEEEFASFCGSNYAVAVASGTDALYLTLKGLGIGPGDEVLHLRWDSGSHNFERRQTRLRGHFAPNVQYEPRPT